MEKTKGEVRYGGNRWRGREGGRKGEMMEKANKGDKGGEVEGKRIAPLFSSNPVTLCTPL